MSQRNYKSFVTRYKENQICSLPVAKKILLIYCIMQGLEKGDNSRVSVPAYQFLYLVTAETSRNGHFITLVLDCLFYARR